MSFAAAFYNFTVDLTHSDREVFTRFRVKTPLHPMETLEHLYARMLAFIHCYREGQTFSQGRFEPKEPTIWHHDVLKEILLWVQVGVPERKKLEVSLKAHSQAEHRIYFYSPNQIREFCQMLRGSKTNWVKDIQFYLLPDHVLEALVPLERSSPEWNATIIDNQLYLTCDGVGVQGTITPIDIWDAYQDLLAQEAAAERNA